jgi:hypothetical protein
VPPLTTEGPKTEAATEPSPAETPRAPGEAQSPARSVLALQRSIGNRETRELLAARREDPARAFQQAARGPGGEVPYRAEMERAFDADFSSVRAFSDRAPELRPLHALAATRGEQAVFASPRPDKATVAHELAHVMQNRRSSASAPLSRPGDAAESEAHGVAQEVLAGSRVQVRAAASGLISRLVDPRPEAENPLSAEEKAVWDDLDGFQINYLRGVGRRAGAESKDDYKVWHDALTNQRAKQYIAEYKVARAAPPQPPAPNLGNGLPPAQPPPSAPSTASAQSQSIAPSTQSTEASQSAAALHPPPAPEADDKDDDDPDPGEALDRLFSAMQSRSLGEIVSLDAANMTKEAKALELDPGYVCFGWALSGLVGFKAGGVDPRPVYGWVYAGAASLDLGGAMSQKQLEDGAWGEAPQETKKWMAANRDDLRALQTRSTEAYKLRKKNQKAGNELNANTTAAVMEMLLVGNGFELDESSPYQVCMYNKHGTGTGFVHWWLRVNRGRSTRPAIIESFPGKMDVGIDIRVKEEPEGKTQVDVFHFGVRSFKPEHARRLDALTGSLNVKNRLKLIPDPKSAPPVLSGSATTASPQPSAPASSLAEHKVIPTGPLGRLLRLLTEAGIVMTAMEATGLLEQADNDPETALAIAMSMRPS